VTADLPGESFPGAEADPARRRVLANIVGLAWVVGAAVVVMAPALRHGLSLGPYDILSQSGLTHDPSTVVRNSYPGDQISEMIPWSNLAWTQVHAGHLPLWNPYSGLGLPLAFNWQSGVFSLPTAVGYLSPLRLAYTVQVLVTLIVAGTGAYALGRVLRLGVIGCMTAGTVYELSGSFFGWVGWPHAAVMSWAGWLFAISIVIVRGRHRVGTVTLGAVIVALAIFSGQPEIVAMLVGSVVVYVLVVLLLRWRLDRDRAFRWRPLGDLSLALVAGVALGAPLVLPGLQVLAGSTRNSGTLLAKTEVGQALPPHDLIHLFVQGWNGLPIAGSSVFGDAVYGDTASYVGPIAIALAIVGVIRLRRRPEVLGFVAVASVTLCIVFVPAVQRVILHLPVVATIDWHRDLMILGLAIAALAGVGMDAVVRHASERSLQKLVAASVAAALVLIGLLRIFGESGLSSVDARLRRESLLWPLTTTAAALVVVLGLILWTRRADARAAASAPKPLTSKGRRPPITTGRVVGMTLLLLETGFLVASGAPLWSSSAAGRPTTTTPVSALVRTVGTANVGFGSITCYAGPGLSGLGILPNANTLFGVHEFDFYDPVLPKEYFDAWRDVSPSLAGVPIYNSFCPRFTTAAQARRFGVGFVLEHEGDVGPLGAVYVARVGNEALYRIPGSSSATLVPLSDGGQLPPADQMGVAAPVVHPSPSSWTVTTTGPRPQVLRLRLTNEPGWHASIDGHPLPLESYAGVMLQARVPAGHHVVELQYWPSLFSVGLVVAGATLIGLMALVAMAQIRRRRASDR
jgi:hypothetical protein